MFANGLVPSDGAVSTAGGERIDARDPWLEAGLDETARTRLTAYRGELLAWNERVNLTAIREPSEVDRRLIGDALRLLPEVDRATGGHGGRLVDVGSGGGLPGLVLKIARLDLDVTLIDATGKKVAFLRETIDRLGLTGARAIHGRAEELGHDPHHRACYDVATARAVAALPVLLELCAPFARVGGSMVFPKGAAIEDELVDGARAAARLGVRIERAEPLADEPGFPVTRLVIAVKIAETAKRFPRRSGLPAREPLGRADR